MKKKNIFILILSIVFFIGCSEDEESDCINYEELSGVTNVEAPETATVNEAVDVNVTFQVQNACGEFAAFDETISGTTRTIGVDAVYEGCACAEVITSRTETYTFTPGTTGQHVLRFKTAPNDFIETRIMVEEAASE